MKKCILLVFTLLAFQCYIISEVNGQSRNLESYLDSLLQTCNCDTTGVDPELLGSVTEARFKGGDSALWMYVKEHLRIPNDPRYLHKLNVFNLTFRLDSIGRVRNIITYEWETPEWKSLEVEIRKLILGMPQWIPSTSGDGKRTFGDHFYISFYVYNGQLAIRTKNKIWK